MSGAERSERYEARDADDEILGTMFGEPAAVGFATGGFATGSDHEGGFETGSEHEEVFNAIGDDFTGADDVAIGGFFGDIVRAASNVTKVATKAVAKAAGSVTKIVAKGAGGLGDLAGKIPVIGTPLHAALDMVNSPFRLADALAHGARVDRAVLSHFKQQIASTRTLAPYAQTVVSMVPGIGSGVSGAIAAASALAQGRPISEAAMAAVKGALPGGPLASAGFDLARKVASGQNVAASALSAARDQLPKEARAAFDVGLALTQGKKMQDALVSAVANLTPAGMVPFAKVGAALTNLAPNMKALRTALSMKEKMGFDIVNGVLAHSGVPEHALLALRQKLGPEAKRGFDAAIATQAKLVKKGALRSVPPMIKDAPGSAALAAAARRAVEEKRNADLIAYARAMQAKQAAGLVTAQKAAAALRATRARPPGMFPVAAGEEAGENGVGGFSGTIAEAVRRANLGGANLGGANLGGANLNQPRGVTRIPVGGFFASLLRNLHRAKLAESHGHTLSPAQMRLLSHFRALHSRSRQGHPKASAFMLAFRKAIDDMKRSRGMSVVR